MTLLATRRPRTVGVAVGTALATTVAVAVGAATAGPSGASGSAQTHGLGQVCADLTDGRVSLLDRADRFARAAARRDLDAAQRRQVADYGDLLARHVTAVTAPYPHPDGAPRLALLVEQAARSLRGGSRVDTRPVRATADAWRERCDPYVADWSDLAFPPDTTKS